MIMSSKPKPSDVRNNLLAAIQRKVPSSPVAPPEPSEPAAVTMVEPEARRKEPRPVAVADRPKRRIGKQVQFWFHDEDGRLVRELAAWLAGQGVRPTDSLVIRAALRTAKAGGELLQAYRQASELDGRLKRHKVK
jgi:hypothetical protein